MQIYRYKSSRQILERVYRDTGIQYDLPWLDMIEWIYEAMEMIGSPMQYLVKIKGINNYEALDIENYRAKLPCDFHKLLWILVNGCPARLATGSDINLLDGNCCDDFVTSNMQGEVFRDNFGNTFDNSLGGISALGTNCNVEFTINNDYLTLSVKEGKVCMAYYSFPVDDEGFPMIPEDEIYQNALTKYLIKKVDHIEWRKGNIAKEIFDYSNSDANWYIAQARNHLLLPDVHQMEGLKNLVIKPIPTLNEYTTMFRNLNKLQQINFRQR